jgi:hypothetical protein
LTDIAAITTPGASFALSGPSAKNDPLNLPVRGDLAHIKLAGRVFVPHYAVPMPHVVGAEGATLLKAAKDDADAIETLAAGDRFDVLDMTGGWAWGVVGEEGHVGYIPLDRLVVA